MDLMVDEIDHVLHFLLEAGNEFARAVLEQDHKAEGEEHKQHQPKKTADQTHAAHVSLPTPGGQRSAEAGGILFKSGHRPGGVIRQQRPLMLR